MSGDAEVSIPKNAIGDIVGRTIEAVVIQVNDDNPNPRHMVFFVFTDGTHYELYGDNINCSGSLSPRGGMLAVIKYLKRSHGGKVFCYTAQNEKETVQ